MMSIIRLQKARIDTVSLQKSHTRLGVLRLDALHPVISGNKWFKLQYYLSEAVATGKKWIVTYGGAYSNHIVAAAAAARAYGLQSAGIIRGEAPSQLSPTLQEAAGYGMQLHFSTRADYKQQLPPALLSGPVRDYYFIHEGGYGTQGARGASNILAIEGVSGYNQIVAAVGTGTMLAGLAMGAGENQSVTGIPVLKNNHSLQAEINALLQPGQQKKFRLIPDYHFGGYAKYNEELLRFMNKWYHTTGIPSDFVYTGKLFYAVQDLIVNNYFQSSDSILVIHSGGLQGNRSLPKGKLIF